MQKQRQQKKIQKISRETERYKSSKKGSTEGPVCIVCF